MNNRHLATKKRLSVISLVNVDDVHSNRLEMITRIRRIRQDNFINNLLSERVLMYLVVKKIVYKPR
jgi:hypothetical protein